MTDTRNVLLKCRHSVLSMIRYDAAAGHVVLVECMSSFIQCFQWFGLYYCTYWICEALGGGVKTVHFFNLQVPGIDIVMDWLIQHPTDQYTHQKCRKYIHLCLRFFRSHLRVFSAHYIVNLPPFRNSYPGSHDTHSSPFPTAVRAFVLIARKIDVQN